MRLKFQDGPQNVTDSERVVRGTTRARVQDAAGEVGDLVASFPAGHLAQIDDDGTLRIFRVSNDATTTADTEVNMPQRLAAFNRRNRTRYAEASK